MANDVGATLEQRGSRYGDWTDNARVADALQKVLEDEPSWATLPPYMRQSLQLIMQKAARIMNGDPFYTDNWHDIAGYAQLAEARAEKGVGQNAGQG